MNRKLFQSLVIVMLIASMIAGSALRRRPLRPRPRLHPPLQKPCLLHRVRLRRLDHRPRLPCQRLTS